ncbi:uncharacterized protein LOC143029621 [Oratosquilla oratoria]|uniref:uncharacterized protein LOC143029621 n=1 Tax=Oratosquilla oratoria TaxID=337810 RepID=UPI003F770A03
MIQTVYVKLRRGSLGQEERESKGVLAPRSYRFGLLDEEPEREEAGRWIGQEERSLPRSDSWPLVTPRCSNIRVVHDHASDLCADPENPQDFDKDFEADEVESPCRHGPGHQNGLPVYDSVKSLSNPSIKVKPSRHENGDLEEDPLRWRVSYGVGADKVHLLAPRSGGSEKAMEVKKWRMSNSRTDEEHLWMRPVCLFGNKLRRKDVRLRASVDSYIIENSDNCKDSEGKDVTDEVKNSEGTTFDRVNKIHRQPVESRPLLAGDPPKGTLVEDVKKSKVTILINDIKVCESRGESKMDRSFVSSFHRVPDAPEKSGGSRHDLGDAKISDVSGGRQCVSVLPVDEECDNKCILKVPIVDDVVSEHRVSDCISDSSSLESLRQILSSWPNPCAPTTQASGLTRSTSLPSRRARSTSPSRSSQKAKKFADVGTNTDESLLEPVGNASGNLKEDGSKLNPEARKYLTLYQHYYPEGGWGWVVLIMASLTHVLTTGIQGAYGSLMTALPPPVAPAMQPIAGESRTTFCGCCY